ncbi:MAG TPA: response regulator [Rhizomicrobium sp.]
MATPNDALVYVVDDDEAVRDSTVILLGSENIAAAGYATARDFLADFDPAGAGCIILDVHMPGMSGIALLGMLWARGVTTPVIVLTGRADTFLESAVRRGGASLLNKPPDGDELLTLVKAALGNPPVT